MSSSTRRPPTRRAEIHSHSTFSDGAYAPERVARLCAEADVTLWSLTDHDTAAGCERAADAAEDLGIDFIPGIEMSAYAEGSIHVLGYGMPVDSDIMREYSERRLQYRDERMEKMVGCLENMDVSVDLARVHEIAGHGAIGRPHLARAMVEAGHVATIGEAFDRYIANDGPAYIATEWPEVPEAIDIIHQADGVAILAHPGLYRHDDSIPAWVRSGLDGIEVGHPKHSDADEAHYEEMADELDVLKTASSDFHGPDHVSIDHFGQVEFPLEWLEPFVERVL